VLDRGWDIVLRNAEACAVFGGPLDLEERRNLLVEVFTEPECTALFAPRDRIAESVVAMFRLDYATIIDDPRTHQLVECLRATVPAFETAWQHHRISEYPEGVREIVHPRAGLLKLAPSMYGVGESPGLRVMAFTFADTATAHRISRLTEEYHTRASVPANLPGREENIGGRPGFGVSIAQR